MSESLVLGEKLFSLLEQSSRSSTYKPALLVAIIDRAPEYLGETAIPVKSLAERVIELYWPQTLLYPTTSHVLQQNQGGQAKMIKDLIAFRDSSCLTSRALPESVRSGKDWERLVNRIEKVLAEYPIPRLQRPFENFLYDFEWPWAEQGGWRVSDYERTSMAISMLPGVTESLTSLGPLLRPFITRWWTDKAAQLNPEVEAARSVVEFEDFMFGRDRVALGRIGEGLLDLQSGRCFYCGSSIAKEREIDHFVPWSFSGDDGLDNLVASCRRCNGSKSATLAGPDHVQNLLERNDTWDDDLLSLADERRWPKNRGRSERIARATYILSPDERPIWMSRIDSGRFEKLGSYRDQLEVILGAGQPKR